MVGSIWGGITSVFTNDYVTVEIEEMFKRIESITLAVELEAKKEEEKQDEADLKTEEQIE